MHNLIGLKFNKLTAEKYIFGSRWLCRCDCGNEAIVATSKLRSGHTKSCGCIPFKRHIIDIIGLKFSKVTVISLADTKDKRTRWNCLCDCGTRFITVGNNLKSGTTKSCGCLSTETKKRLNTTHGMFYTSVYKIWGNMKQRCSNPKTTHYPDYGGRGITVCDRWQKFENFYKDMGDRPDGLTLERVNNDKGYSKENCVWATRTENANNKRNNRTININGVDKTISQWCRIYGINRCTVKSRVRSQGLNYVDAITRPVKKPIHNNGVK